MHLSTCACKAWESIAKVEAYPIPAMFLGVVQGWSAVPSFSRQAVLYPCRQYRSNLSSSLCLHGVTAAKYLKFPTALAENVAIACLGKKGEKTVLKKQWSNVGGIITIDRDLSFKTKQNESFVQRVRYCSGQFSGPSMPFLAAGESHRYRF